jgi:hypothetical protein
MMKTLFQVFEFTAPSWLKFAQGHGQKHHLMNLGDIVRLVAQGARDIYFHDV